MSIATLVLFSVPDSRIEEDAGHEGSVCYSHHTNCILLFLFRSEGNNSRLELAEGFNGSSLQLMLLDTGDKTDLT